MKFGLLGKKLAHSFSKEIHAMISDYEYKMYEKEPEEIKDFVNSNIDGFNVTIPYKVEIMKYLDEISPRAKSIGCVNTVIKRNGKVYGDNTDYYGFSYILDSLNEDFTKAIVLGDGATSQTIDTVLKDRNIEINHLSRKNPPFYNQIEEFEDCDLLINATPVGMYPNNGKSLVELDKLENLKGVLDVVYNPNITELLFKAKERNIKYSNGLAMLVAQAVEAARIFLDKDFDKSLIEQIYKKIDEEQNIVLIGMPGSGKTTIGRLLAQKINKKFVDIDQEIAKKSKKTIPQIFDEVGEEGFRKIEREVTANFGKEKNQVISTGGGVVTINENYKPLKQNGRIYFIERELEALSQDERPLSKDFEAVKKLWDKRKDKYEEFSDYKLENIDIETCIDEIIEDFYENITN